MNARFVVMELDGGRRVEVSAPLFSLAALAWADRIQPTAPGQVIVASAHPFPLQVIVYTIKRGGDGRFEAESGGAANCLESVLEAALSRKFPGIAWTQTEESIWTSDGPGGFQAVFDVRSGWNVSVLLACGGKGRSNCLDAVAADLARVMREQADRIARGL